MPQRTCQRCTIEFEVPKFSSAKWCDDCREARRRETQREYDGKRRPRPVHQLTCQHCSAAFEHSGMGPKAKYCQSCRASWQQIYDGEIRTRNPYRIGSARKWHLKYRYGLTEEQWNALFEQQRRRCAICGSSAEDERWRTDHDHVSGLVRGILCHHCNVGIGHFRDEPDRLRAAADYIERSRSELLETPAPDLLRSRLEQHDLNG